MRYCFFGTVVHTFLCGYLQRIGAVTTVGQGCVAQPRIGVFQLGIGDTLLLGKVCQAGNGGIYLHGLTGYGRVELALLEQETIALGMTDNRFGRQETEHIA